MQPGIVSDVQAIWIGHYILQPCDIQLTDSLLALDEEAALEYPKSGLIEAGWSVPSYPWVLPGTDLKWGKHTKYYTP